ncbi:hypothetical protein QTG54_001525 [Skeletonema marinoi]|uniref:GPI transamidase component PIG-S n=1 Tax=Skeletonema marinoi TaxID=267567 RepID=A0AAD8YLN7_9STRA|nr:hypothetical protein QTG54_001525 [Skeletonema marinoi]
MAGTRLAVHSVFVVQLICLVAASFLYASIKPFDPSSSADPFISDQSGWKILVEDVSPVPLHDGSIGGYIRDYFDVVVAEVAALLGLGEEEQVHHHHAERRTSVFLQQMRQQLSKLPLKYINHDDKSVVLPQLKMNFHMPMIDDVTVINRLASELEGAIIRGNSANQPSLGIILAPSNDASDQNAAEEVKSCEEWSLPESTHLLDRNTRKLKLPDLYLLTDCTKTSVDVPDSDAIVIRTTHTDNDVNGLEQYLQAEIAPILLKIVYQASTQKQMQMQRLERVFVQLIDEDPTSHREGGDAKVHFDLLSRALSTSLQSTISPMIHDLSFIYGGNVELFDDAIFWKGAIDLSSAPSAYLPLPNNAIEIDRGDAVDREQGAVNSEDEAESVENEEYKSVSTKFVTTVQMSKFIQSHSSSNEGLEWVLFLPSRDHSPLTLRDSKSGDNGQSIVLSGSKPAGVSLVQMDDDKYINSLSHSLNYLAGYIRELNGLQSKTVMEAYDELSSTTTPVNYIGRSAQSLSISFWELESIAQRHWYAVLQQVLHEIDAVMSLLHKHGSTLALPEHVAKKINTATNLLRKSISFVEEGLPVMYATSALYGALATIESVQADAELFELPYFAPDHYLAVFSPLVLPLVMPMIFGLIREVKRYKELKRKRQI